MKIWGVGYTGLSMEKLVAWVVEANAVLVDVRWQPFSRAPIWRRGEFQGRLGDRYVHVRELGNEHHKQPQLGIQIHDMETGLLRVDREVFGRGYDAVLMCACAEVTSCHRRVIVQAVADRWPGCASEEVPRVLLEPDLTSKRSRGLRPLEPIQKTDVDLAQQYLDLK